MYLAPSMKKTIPRRKSGVLLNSATYDPTDVNWDNGNYLDLAPYLQDLDKTMVLVLAQGFPWISDATAKRREIFRASKFYNRPGGICGPGCTKDIWFNTGSFPQSTPRTTNNACTCQLTNARPFWTAF